MNTKEFIEKVSKAKEIQNIRKEDQSYFGDYYWYKGEIHIDVDNSLDFEGEHFDSFNWRKSVWLPTLEQLFEIHTKYYPVGILSMVFELNKWLQNSFFKNYKSLNEAMLTLIMEKIYSKQWNPDKRKWEAKNE